MRPITNVNDAIIRFLFFGLIFMILYIVFTCVYSSYKEKVRRKQTQYEKEHYQKLGIEKAVPVIDYIYDTDDDFMFTNYTEQIKVEILGKIHTFLRTGNLLLNKPKYKDIKAGDLLILECGSIDGTNVYCLDGVLEETKLNWRHLL